MKQQSSIRHIEMNIGGVDYGATYVVEDDILYAAINGKAYTCLASPQAEGTVRAMMIEEALRDSLRCQPSRGSQEVRRSTDK
jgi:hypothetical protein